MQNMHSCYVRYLLMMGEEFFVRDWYPGGTYHWSKQFDAATMFANTSELKTILDRFPELVLLVRTVQVNINLVDFEW